MQNDALAQTKPGAQVHDPTTQAATKQARNTHESSKPPSENTHHLRTNTNHRSKVSLRELFIEMAARTGDEGRTTHKFARRAPATGESSRARSFARSHACTQRKRKRNRNRFPGSGVGLKPAPHPQPPIIYHISYIIYHISYMIYQYIIFHISYTIYHI